jgi:hypothetical protein
LTRARRRRLLLRVLFRSLAGVLVLVALYYVVPLQDLKGVHLGVSLTLGMGLLAVVIVAQVRAITASRYPAVRAVEALALTAPLFLLMYASAYIILAQDSAANFSTHQLSRTDALYFTVTVFSTVGFGDITAASQSARVIVTLQMVLDLVIIGLGVQAFRAAVSMGRQRSGAGSPDEPPQDPPSHPEGIAP